MTPETKELLALAAKAIGSELVIHGDGSTNLQFQGGTMNWQPHTDDGDSRRLEAGLCMLVGRVGDEVLAGRVDDMQPLAKVSVPLAGGDALAATRLAVLRAAAEIGRAMP